ncbi:MAG TPA: exodeoxyribonuclease VII large subunit [Ginsengibacter sp.]|nr:exodeoxyribonuclease VII large subunit [Ginsengibacter sp.]HRP18575.1 exodeoxyribonuclease VII large subunit [Ginsengibacter sp.]
MPENVSNRTVFSLLEVMQSIKKTLESRYTSAFWVKAEMNKLNLYQHSGHCYPDLVEKAEGKVVAEIRSTLWGSDYRRINQKFLAILKEPLRDGIKILFSARINFDPKYGLSLQILDIDPSFTLGDLEKEKQETIQRLQQDGLWRKNKEVPFPLLPKRIAIISVETSKGYADFMTITQNNPWGYKFFFFLFPSLLQGERAAATIMQQLRRIKKVKKYFDAVAIIRGGGGEVGLTCYNNFELSRMICEFPIPVITGIGHATNETVTEMVAHTNAITPTKLAEFLIQKFHNYAEPVKRSEKKIIDISRLIIKENQTSFHNAIRIFRNVTERMVNTHHHQIEMLGQGVVRQSRFLFYKNKETLLQTTGVIKANTGFIFRNTKTQLEGIEKNIANLHPDNILKRGFSITLLNGKSISHTGNLKKGDEILTLLAEGGIKSTVTSTSKKKSS